MPSSTRCQTQASNSYRTQRKPLSQKNLMAFTSSPKTGKRKEHSSTPITRQKKVLASNHKHRQNIPALKKIRGFLDYTTGSTSEIPETVYISSGSETDSDTTARPQRLPLAEPMKMEHTSVTQEEDGTPQAMGSLNGGGLIERARDNTDEHIKSNTRRFIRATNPAEDTAAIAESSTAAWERELVTASSLPVPSRDSKTVSVNAQLDRVGMGSNIQAGAAGDVSGIAPNAISLDGVGEIRAHDEGFGGPSNEQAANSVGTQSRPSTRGTTASSLHLGQRDINQHFNFQPPPLPMIELPRQNPFLRGYQPDEDDDTDNGYLSQANDLVPREPPPLVTARESGFFDTTVETGHEDAAVRTAAGAVYFRWHVIEEDDVRLLLIADRIQTKSPLYQVIRANCMRHQSVYQNKAMKWYKQGVSATIEAMGGMAAFINATSEERQAVWRTMFARDPLRMAVASMPSAHLSVDLRGIYASSEAKAQAWRRFIKTCFVWMAEDTFIYRLVNNDDETAFTNWKAMPRRRALNGLDLGDTLSVPVRHGGMYDKDRRRVDNVPMNNPTYVLEDD